MEPILSNGAWKPARNPAGSFHAFNPVSKEALSGRVYPVSGWDDLQDLLDAGQNAARDLAAADPSGIGAFLEAYATEIEDNADALVEAAQLETGLPREPRLRSVELPRTTGQLRQAAAAARDGGWRRPVIDTKAGIRSVHGPLGGPVAVFGPNNFPFAFNGISGGDFAAAMAAGNPVIAKAHPAHPHTSTLLARAALTAIEASGLPRASVQMFYRCAPELGRRLVSHPSLAAVGFTGGRTGGTALKEAADRVGKPIYLEMSSVNPVFVLTGALRERGGEIAAELVGSCALGAGQFCTKPGLAVVESGPEAEAFLATLRTLTSGTPPGTLLTAGGPREIDSAVSRMTAAGASVLAGGEPVDGPGYAYQPTLLRASGSSFLASPEALQSEAFGSVCLVVVAGDLQEMVAIAAALEGNLTGCLYTASDGGDDPDYARIEPELRRKVGRLLNDKMPTGVAVSPAMNHGGPFPATGHPHFTAVGIPASLLRFTALHSYDNVRPHRLPAILRDKNPGGSLLRQIDGVWTTADVPLYIPRPLMPPNIPTSAILGDAAPLRTTRTSGDGPAGRLPITDQMLREEPSGHLFGLTQNAGMGWRAAEIGRDPYLIISTSGGLRDGDGSPVALGYHTGHWEIDRLVRVAAETISNHGALPFAAACSDPCDGRSQGTSGMFDSLPYRNDAAITMRRLIRSLPLANGVLGVATCDKGLPATMLALAGCGALPGVIVPGGVTLPARDAEDTAKVQSIGARYVHGLIDLDHAATMGCRACGSPGGGCQFLGTAATSQVVAEALGMALPHSALCPSGEPAWLDLAHRSALALLALSDRKIPLSRILTPEAIDNAMLVHAAFGGSTNLLLHIPAIAHAAGCEPPTVQDWIRVNKATPRLVDALPNGPRNHPTVQVFMAGGVPEVMLHLRDMNLLHLDVLTVTGQTLGENLAWWEHSETRRTARARLRELDGIDPDHVIFSPDTARATGLASALVFPTGNIAPEGSVIKATSIDPSVIDPDHVYRHTGRARVFTSERDAIMGIKGQGVPAVEPGEVIILIGSGPAGTGMEETYQLTSALKYLPWGKHVPVITDARFSGVSTGACIGHVGPEALAGGPVGKLRDDDLIEIEIDRDGLAGRINFIGTDVTKPLSPEEASVVLARRDPSASLAPHPGLPDDTRLWAALQEASGGTWAGCVYDVDRIIAALQAGREHHDHPPAGRPAGSP